MAERVYVNAPETVEDGKMIVAGNAGEWIPFAWPYSAWPLYEGALVKQILPDETGCYPPSTVIAVEDPEDAGQHVTVDRSYAEATNG